MDVKRIAASSYSNTAPLIWSFLFGSQRGTVELALDNAPARSVELLDGGRVDAALTPVIAYQMLDGVRLVPGVCVGARERVQSVCLVTRGMSLSDVSSVALDISSRTSAALTKIIFREFIGREPAWMDAAPNIDAMLASADAALVIGDPALSIDSSGQSGYRKFDLAELWRSYTGFGFVFAMWMTRREKVGIDLAAARDEGLGHVDDIISNYEPSLALSREEMRHYLRESISYEIDGPMQSGLELFFRLAEKCGLTERNRPLEFAAT